MKQIVFCFTLLLAALPLAQQQAKPPPPTPPPIGPQPEIWAGTNVDAIANDLSGVLSGSVYAVA